MSQTEEVAGYYAALESYNGSGPQSLVATDKLEEASRSVFWNDNDTTQQIIHGCSLCELTTSGTSKSANWGGNQTFSIDNKTDCIGDLYLSITVEFNTPDTPLDTELNPRTITTLLQKPSSREALKDSSLLEKKGWYKRGIKKGETRPKSDYIGFPNGWKHLKTDANDLGSGFRFGDGGMDAIDNYGLPSEAVNLPGIWGVGPDSAPRAQAWEEIQDVLKKDTDLFKIDDYSLTNTYLDPTDNQNVIHQREKDIGIGEFVIQEQGRTASNCYDNNSDYITSVDRFRSFNVMDKYYHNGIKNKFKDEYSQPPKTDDNSWTLSSIFNDEKLKNVRDLNISGIFKNSGSSQETFQISATFPRTVTVSELQAKSSSYCSTLETTMNTVRVNNNLGDPIWVGNIASTVVNTSNKNWDDWIGRQGANTSIAWPIASIITSNTPGLPFNDHPLVIESILITTDPGQSNLNKELLDMYCVNLSNVFSTYTMNTNLNSSVIGTYNNWPGNIRHYTGELKGFRNVYDINEDVLTGNISTGTKNASLNDKTERLMSLYEDSIISAFEPYPGQRLITCKIQEVAGTKYLLFEFWDPATFGGLDITPSQLNDYRECTKSIIYDLQNRSDTFNTAAPEPRIFFDITSSSGNTFSILNKIMLLSSPPSQMPTGVGDYIGTGPIGSSTLNEDTVQFDLSMNPPFKYPMLSHSPWTPSLDCIDNPQPTVTNPPPPAGFQPIGRITTKINKSIYTIDDINNLGLGPIYAQNFTRALKLYIAYKARGDYTPVINYITVIELNSEFIELLFEINFGVDYDKVEPILKTLKDMVYEIISPPQSLSTIKNKKGHDNIINPSLIPYTEHPILNPYASSYMPKYLSYTDSEKIKKTGTEFIDLKEDGTYGIYVSPGILANDLFVSYLNKEDINTLVNQYNDPSLGGLEKDEREIPEYFGSTTPPDGTEITYLQKIEVVEDPPRRPDNLVFYQSDYNGFCTKISSDGNTYAVSQGRMFGDEYETGTSSGNTRVRRPGLVRVYKKNNDVWSLSKIFRAPNSILSVFPRGHMWNVSNGYNSHVDLSADGNRIVIGAAGGWNNYFNTYDYNSSTGEWISRDEAFSTTMPPSFGPGQTLVSPTASGVQDITNGNLPSNYTFGTEFGSTLSLSADGNRIALIKLDHPQQPDWTRRHCVKIYDWDSNSLEWVENSYGHTTEINNLKPHNNEGSISACIGLSGDGKTYVIGNPVPKVDSIYNITVDVNNNVYSIDGNSSPPILVCEGSTYVFDWSLSAAVAGAFRISTTSDGTHGGGVEYTNGVTVDTTTSTTTLIANEQIPLYYYSTNFPGMGGQIPYTFPSNGFVIYRLYDNPNQGFPTRWYPVANTVLTRGAAKSVAINYDGSRVAIGNVDYDIGSGRIDIYHVANPNDIQPTYQLISSQYGDQNSFLGYSLSFNQDGTKLAAGSPYGFSDENPLKKTISRDESNNLFLTVQNQRQETVNGRLDVLHNRNNPNDPFEFEASKDANAKYIKDRGGAFYDTKLGQVTDWRTSESSASLGMRSERQRVANGFVHVYEYISGNWENVLKIDASSGERNENDQKSWPGTYGEYGIYKGTADGLGVSVSMNGDGTSIIAGAPLMSTIGKIQEKLDWYPGGGMTAAYSINEEGETAVIEEGDPVSSVLLADTSRRSHTRETEEEVGRSYVFNLGKYKYNETPTPPEKDINSIPMTYTDGYNIVNDAQRRLNHDITDFVDLPEIGDPIRWDKQFTAVPDGANYPPLRGDYQRPEWADSDLKSKAKFPLLNIIKKIEILVDEKVWQTITYFDLLSIYSTEIPESLYNKIGSNSSGSLRNDGTRQAKSSGRWIPGKKYDLTIPIPSFTSSLHPRFNNFTQCDENGFLSGLTDSFNFKVRIYYNDLEKVWDINNVSAMQGYTAPIYTVPHTTIKIEDGIDSNGNPSSLIEDGARYETTGKSSGTGLYITNFPEAWKPNISFNTKMFGKKFIMNKDEISKLKNTPNGIIKKINTTQSINSKVLKIYNNTGVSIDLDAISIYSSHLIINIEYNTIFFTPYLKTAQLFLNSKPFSKLDSGMMKGILNKTLGIYSNEYINDKDNLDPSKGNYIYPLSGKYLGGSSIQFSNFDTIRLELFFESPDVTINNTILAENTEINITVRGQSNVTYKNGISTIAY